MLQFEVLGFPVRIDPTFWLVSVMLGITGSTTPPGLIIWVGVVLVSILIHELGHAIAAQAFGHRAEILLYSMGGVTSHRGPRLSHAQSIWVSFAGPLAGFGLYAGLEAVQIFAGVPQNFYVYLFYAQMKWVNLFWGLANLLPLLPLDGGHIMESAVHWTSRRPNRTLVLQISIAAGVGAALFALTYGYFFGALFAGWLTYNNWTDLQNNSRFGPRSY